MVIAGNRAQTHALSGRPPSLMQASRRSCYWSYSSCPFMSLASFRTTADDSLVTFDGGIGVDRVSRNTLNAPVLNVVRGIPLEVFHQVIKRLRGDVQRDGRIHVDEGRLLLSGGNVFGANGRQKVTALLFFGTPGAMLVMNGDF